MTHLASLALLFATLGPGGGVAEARGFDRIDFKYNSNHHLSPRMRFATVEAPIEDVVRMIRARVKAEGGLLIDRPEPFRVSMPANARDCWDQAMVITRAEWSAFTLNKHKPYKKIKRPALCPEVNASPAGPDQGAEVLKFEMPARAAETIVQQRVVDNFSWDGSGLADGSANVAEAVLDVVGGVGVSTTTVERTAQTQFTSRLIFSLWSDGDRTRVYGFAVPANGGVEAAPGNSIGHIWFDEVRAERESRLVRVYLEWLENWE